MDTCVKKEKELKQHIYNKCLKQTNDKEFSKRVAEKEYNKIKEGLK